MEEFSVETETNKLLSIAYDLGSLVVDDYNSCLIKSRAISQHIFNELVSLHCLIDYSLYAFRDRALQDVHLGEYPGVKDGSHLFSRFAEAFYVELGRLQYHHKKFGVYIRSS